MLVGVWMVGVAMHAWRDGIRQGSRLASMTEELLVSKQASKKQWHKMKMYGKTSVHAVLHLHRDQERAKIE